MYRAGKLSQIEYGGQGVECIGIFRFLNYHKLMVVTYKPIM